MTLPGLDVTVAASVAAAIGNIRHMSDRQRLVACLGPWTERCKGEKPELDRNTGPET